MAQGTAVPRPYCSIVIGVDLNWDGSDFTFGVVLIGIFLVFLALALVVPALHIALDLRDERAHGKPVSIGRLGSDFLAAGFLLVVAVAPAYGAARLFWAAHRGDFRPYATVRAEARGSCRYDANAMGLTGPANDQYVSQCVAKAVTAAEND